MEDVSGVGEEVRGKMEDVRGVVRFGRGKMYGCTDVWYVRQEVIKTPTC